MHNFGPFSVFLPIKTYFFDFADELFYVDFQSVTKICKIFLKKNLTIQYLNVSLPYQIQTAITLKTTHNDTSNKSKHSSIIKHI